VIRLAANLTLASSRGAVIAGATVRDLYSALPSQMGLHAVELAEAGFKGEPLAVETTFGRILAPEFDVARCVAGLGERWLMDRNYTKRYPGCRNFQGAIDCILDALPTLQRPFDAARDRMVVGIDPLGYADNRGLHTESPLAAMESAPVSIALTVVHGRLTPDLYSRGAYLEDRVLALANRLEFAEAERKTPDQRPGWVRIEQTGAAPVERSVTIPSGSAERPMPETELKDKFVRNAKAALGEKAADAAAHILTAPGAEPFRACLARWIGRSG